MKKAIYFLGALLFIATYIISCDKKDDSIIDEGLITLEELDGWWSFVSYNYGGTEYNCQSQNLPEIELIFMDINFDVSNLIVYITSPCQVFHSLKYDFTKDTNTIIFDGESNEIVFVFTIQSYSGTQLIQRVDQTPYPNIFDYLGGTLILSKSL